MGMAVLHIPETAQAADPTTNSQYFPETKHTISGKFLDYWNANGGLPVFGYPISDAKNEVDSETGKTFLTQWFERNRFELHPELASTKYEVELGLLGNHLRREALAVDPDFLRANVLYDPNISKDQQWYFQETRHNLRLGFLTYWLQHGGLDRFGYPISEEHREVDPESGNVCIVQWFERARFEYHPENKAPYDILLGLLGNQIKAPKSQIEFAWTIANKANALAVDDAGNLYALDSAQSLISKFDNGGKFIRQWGSYGSDAGQFNTPTAIAVDNAGNVYVDDAGNKRIEKFDNSGKFISQFGNTKGAGQLNEPQGIGVDKQGNLFVIDWFHNQQYSLVIKFDSNGKFVSQFVDSANYSQQLHGPEELAVDSVGNVYVACAGIDYVGVLEFDNNGNYLQEWPNFGLVSPHTADRITLAVDNQGALYENDHSQNRIYKLNSSQLQVNYYGSYGSGDGEFESPTAIAVDSQGNIFVSDFANKRIQKFRQH
jgi:streptogramin lyase